VHSELLGSLVWIEAIVHHKVERSLEFAGDLSAI
jgi:hypothetical protein